ncbi:MAG: PilZ domain-containing protein [Desulfobacterales bacterium]|nr:PilZ domain-containing protein [Desulfobacterales bacterium]MDJ0856350.1 PilZ domain-containing protein [Desulfobacterales bacterium]MDJ0887361.1 PilZ domain-containing protein [Desulfobacterales bacterium]MDJ0990876.1 PilZ domain-containing protein [Desulfobacterales bacterium]
MVKRIRPQTGQSKPSALRRRHGVKSRNTRLHVRKTCFVETHFAANRQLFEGIIKNLSAGGTYIQVKGRFSIGGDIIVAGPFAANQDDVKRRGKIVRLDGQGIGVRFSQ